MIWSVSWPNLDPHSTVQIFGQISTLPPPPSPVFVWPSLVAHTKDSLHRNIRLYMSIIIPVHVQWNWIGQRQKLTQTNGTDLLKVLYLSSTRHDLCRLKRSLEHDALVWCHNSLSIMTLWPNVVCYRRLRCVGNKSGWCVVLFINNNTSTYIHY